MKARQMKLATLKNGRPDGQLVVVSRNLSHFVAVGRIASTLQAALDDWENLAPQLEEVSAQLNRGDISGQIFDPALALAPLPRAYQWIECAAYMGHLDRVRSLKGSKDEELQTQKPLMYQGGSDDFSSAHAPILVPQEDLAIDFEAEIAAILGPVPMGTLKQDAGNAVRLLTVCNDVSLRRLVVDDLNNGFGFFHAKPATCFAPIVATPDEFGDAWANDKLNLTVKIEVNGQLYGQPNAGEDMDFDFADLISTAAQTRNLSCGTILGAGTIANRHEETLPLKKDGVGFACIAEARTAEKAKFGKARTPFLKDNDHLRIEAFDQDGQSAFGAMDQKISVISKT